MRITFKLELEIRVWGTDKSELWDCTVTEEVNPNFRPHIGENWMFHTKNGKIILCDYAEVESIFIDHQHEREANMTVYLDHPGFAVRNANDVEKNVSELKGHGWDLFRIHPI